MVDKLLYLVGNERGEPKMTQILSTDSKHAFSVGVGNIVVQIVVDHTVNDGTKRAVHALHCGTLRSRELLLLMPERKLFAELRVRVYSTSKKVTYKHHTGSMHKGVAAACSTGETGGVKCFQINFSGVGEGQSNLCSF